MRRVCMSTSATSTRRRQKKTSSRKFLPTYTTERDTPHLQMAVPGKPYKRAVSILVEQIILIPRGAFVYYLNDE